MSFGGNEAAESAGREAKSNDSGFRVVEKAVSPKECDGLLESLMGSRVSRGRAGARHLMAVPQVARLAEDPRLLRLAQAELGGRAIPFRATLFEKSGKANWLVVWHQDTALPLKHRFNAPGWGPWSEKAGIHYAHEYSDSLILGPSIELAVA